MNRLLFEKLILSPLKEWSHLGETKNEAGSHLIGHVPHIAPKAYLHIVYQPINKCDIGELEKRLDATLPGMFREFLKCSNGLEVFNATLVVMGYVPLNPSREVHPYFYPYNIVMPNRSARLPGINGSSLVVGRYRNDDSWAILMESGKVVRVDNTRDRNVIDEWLNFDKWIVSEVARLCRLYGHDGRLIADKPRFPFH